MKLFALLTCDEILIDSGSGKHSILGHFSSIKVKDFPASHPALTLFVALTDIPLGDHSLELKFLSPADTAALAAPPPPPPKPSFFSKPAPPAPPAEPGKILQEQKLTSGGPDQRLYFISVLKDLSFETAGVYQLSVSVDKTPLGSTGLTVAKA